MSEITLKKAAFITAAARYTTIIFSIVFSAILSRILTPEDYGIVAVVAIFLTLFNLLGDLGLGTAIIQKKELSTKNFNDIFTFTFFFSIILSVIFLLLAYPISLFFKNEIYITICSLFSVTVFFNTLNTVPNAYLMKNKKFLLAGVRTIIISLFGYSITVFLALKGFKYYSLIINSIIISMISLFWNLKTSRTRFSRHPDIGIIKELLPVSFFQFSFNLVNFFARNMDNLMIGKFFGTTQLGYYDKAYKFMYYPIQNLAHVITPVLHPILAEHQDDRGYIYETYLRIVKFLSLFGILISVLCFWNSSEIILLIYGSQWNEAARCFSVLSLSIWFQMTLATAGSIFQSLGDTRRLFLASLINTTLSVTLIASAVIFGNSIYSVSISVAIAYSLHFIVTFNFLVRVSFGRSYFDFFKRLIPDIIIYGLLLQLTKLIHISSGSDLLNLIIKTSIISLSWLILVIVTGQFEGLQILRLRKSKRSFI